MTGALIGSLADVAGFRPLFPTPSEHARHAIARVRPNVVLVDWDASDQHDWVGSVAEYGGAVVLFSPWRTAPDLRAIAATLGVAYFTLPIHWSEFRRILELAVGDTGDQ